MSDTIEEFLRQPAPCLHPPSDLELVTEYQRYIGGHQVYIYRCNNCGQEVEREKPNRFVRPPKPKERNDG